MWIPAQRSAPALECLRVPDRQAARWAAPARWVRRALIGIASCWWVAPWPLPDEGEEDREGTA